MLELKVVTPISSILDYIGGKASARVNKELLKRANMAVTMLKAVTPKDTGRAASSWRLEHGGLPFFSGSTSFSWLRTINVSIVNDVPYIKYLNMGHSKQAPPRFIESTLAAAGLRKGV